MSEKQETERTVTGKVISDRMDKTITVRIERYVKHPLYGKYIRRSTKLKAHDENNESRVGDLVSLAECRPISRHKSWRLVGILEKSAE